MALLLLEMGQGNVTLKGYFTDSIPLKTGEEVVQEP